MGLYANVLLETLQYCFVLSIVCLFTFLGAENSTLMANERSERFNRRTIPAAFHTNMQGDCHRSQIDKFTCSCPRNYPVSKGHLLQCSRIHQSNN